MRFLIIEDNPAMAATIRNNLIEAGFTADVSSAGFEGEELAASGGYDAVILDRMLPDRDGLTVCQNLRQRDCQVPVLILTGLVQTQQKVNGFEAGADDYLTKPFEFDELLARLRALTRRGRAAPSLVLQFEGLCLDLASRSVTREGVKIKLTSTEFMLLSFLMRNADRVVTRREIAEGVWDTSYDSESNVIDVYISSLRKKVDRDFDRKLIHTQVKAGYWFGPDETRNNSHSRASKTAAKSEADERSAEATCRTMPEPTLRQSTEPGRQSGLAVDSASPNR